MPSRRRLRDPARHALASVASVASVAFCLACLACLACLVWPALARADDTDDAEEVVVRGRSSSVGGGFVSEARVADAPREITDLASLVEPLPGVHVRRLGADDAFSTVSVRGTSSTQVAVYLAGVPLSGGADPTLDLATLPLFPGMRARVYRSFAPAALGRGSLGGTLVIDPPAPRSKPTTEAWIGAGAFGSRRMRVGDVSGDPDGIRVATALSASRSDDDFSYLDEAATRDRGTDVLATRANAGHSAASGLASIGLPVQLGGGKRGALTITSLAQIRRQELPGPLRGPTPFQRLDSNRLVGAMELTLPAGDGSFGARTWARREGLSIRDAPTSTQITLGPSATDDAILAAGGSVGWKGRPSEKTLIEARLDASAERFAPGTWIGFEAPPSARRTNTGIALDARARVAPPITVMLSGRGDVWFDSAAGTASTNETRPSGNVGLEADLGAITLATHGGVLARPPSFVERFGNRGAFLGEPNLRPESAGTIDLGGEITKRVGPMRLHVELAGFATWAEDLIVFVPTGAYGRARATNIGRGRMLGTEALLQTSGFGFELRVAHTALTTQNQSECRFVAGACERPALPGRPEHDLYVDLAYTLGPARLRYGIDVVTGIQADQKGEEKFIVPDRVLHGAGIRVAVPVGSGAGNLSLSLEVRNLFDLRVAEYGGTLGPVRAPIGDLFDYPIPGRRVLLSARWVFPEPGAGATVRAPP
ncbi:MAG: TonB-dependent receptor [Labilithrix sp.]|nr:TonB-dependent receptor [Labilithrix sp.]